MTSLVLDYEASNIRLEQIALLGTYLSRLQQAANIFFDVPPEPVLYESHSLQGKVLILRHQLEVSEFHHSHDSPQELINVEGVTLNGVELQLPDPENGGRLRRLSFVSTHHQEPAFDGMLVLAENRSECQFYTHQGIQQADWFLAVPKVSIRLYLAEWIPELMGWVRRHFIPTLHSAIVGDFLAQTVFPETSPLAPGIMFMRGDKRDIEFAALIEKFLTEVRLWTDSGTGLPR